MRRGNDFGCALAGAVTLLRHDRDRACGGQDGGEPVGALTQVGRGLGAGQQQDRQPDRGVCVEPVPEKVDGLGVVDLTWDEGPHRRVHPHHQRHQPPDGLRHADHAGDEDPQRRSGPAAVERGAGVGHAGRAADRGVEDERRLVDDPTTERTAVAGQRLQRHDGAGRVPDDHRGLADLGRQGQQVVDLTREVGRRVGGQLGAVEPAPDPHDAEARRELRGDLRPGRLVWPLDERTSPPSSA